MRVAACACAGDNVCNSIAAEAAVLIEDRLASSEDAKTTLTTGGAAATKCVSGCIRQRSQPSVIAHA